MFRHVVLFRWTADASESDKRRVAEALRRLPGVIPEIRSYRFGADAGVNEGNVDFAVVADFDDVAGYLAYRDHPAHRAVIADQIAPILSERAAVQFEAGDES
jgi:hypothetical protein